MVNDNQVPKIWLALLHKFGLKRTNPSVPEKNLAITHLDLATNRITNVAHFLSANKPNILLLSDVR